MNPVITTYSGKHICPLDIQVEDINIEDIIIAGSNICRFGGHLEDVYSINEHQLLCLDIARSMSNDLELHFMALTHDICEIYSPIGDCLKPCKDAFTVICNNQLLSINEYEDYLQSIIIRAITGKSFNYHDPRLKVIDAMALNTESLYLRGFSINNEYNIFKSFCKRDVQDVRALYRYEFTELIKCYKSCDLQ